MKVLALLAVIVGGSMAAPAKLDGLDHHQHHNHDDGSHHHFRNDPVSSNFAGYNYEPPAVPSGLYDPPAVPSGLYDPPAVPSGLYELPSDKVEVSTTTTTTTTPPPPPPTPAGGYLPPPTTQKLEDSEVVEAIVLPETSMQKMLMPYNIDWAVQDPTSGNSFSHVENSNGVDVTGEYSVLLPDNRLQIVRFTSDPVNGYRAEVFYEPA